MKEYQRVKKPIVFVSYNEADKDVTREVSLFLISENICGLINGKFLLEILL